MLKKIILAVFLFSSFAFAGEKTDYDLVEIVLKDGKYYIKGTEKLYTGYMEYINSETQIKVKEEDYKDGVMIQERKYYESGNFKIAIRYADGEPFLEENFLKTELCGKEYSTRTEQKNMSILKVMTQRIFILLREEQRYLVVPE